MYDQPEAKRVEPISAAKYSDFFLSESPHDRKHQKVLKHHQLCITICGQIRGGCHHRMIG
jgi:hypothetical protein